MPSVPCGVCNTLFHRKPSHLNRSQVHFCSKACSGKYHSQKKTVNKVNCTFCNKELLRTNNELRRSSLGMYFCDNKCKNEYVSKTHRWAGKNPNTHRGRKETLFKAANYTCQKCGYNEDQRMLDVHHADENHQNNEFLNLRCVCTWCHGLHHRTDEKLNLSPLLDNSGKPLDSVVKAV